ncbi:S8 family peptidase [Virgibacillus litoralis]|uniref:Serine protease AprX n=1 Tax=Virgibacillus litoralis TaxID=578221 RepID=A0ABS4HGJ7_9BACI|nr:S8 family serine peptidase [Virgibacillus litoralis]MBP1950050.1 serine protease AprX [Virgibacillus litoralis]
MEYIINLSRFLTEEDRNSLMQKHIKIIYESKFIELIGVETDNIREVKKMEFIEKISRPVQGEFQEGEFNSTITFEPRVRRTLLSSRSLVGWGDTRIAILDSGVKPDVSVTATKDFTNTGMMDIQNHGNDVAKIVKFLAKGSSLFIAKVGNTKPTDLYVMHGLEWAYNQGASIINISAGFNRRCSGNCNLCTLVNKIANAGVTIVIAAGNNENLEDSIECPGHAINGITVGAVGHGCKLTSYTSFGKVGEGKPNIVAPGNLNIDGRYINGTSFASPFVSGVLGAILRKSGSVGKAVEYIYKSVDDLGHHSHEQGLGYLNLEKLVEVLDSEENNSPSAGQNQSS